VAAACGNGTLYLSGSNSYASSTAANDGVLVLNSANALSGSGLNLDGGIVGLGDYGDFTRLQGSAYNWATAGRVHWRGHGGFAAYGAERTVNIGGAGGFLGFGSGNVGEFIGTMNGKTLVLGAADATHKLVWANGLDVGSVSRTLQVNKGLAAVDAELSGGVRGGTGAGLTKTGTGTLLISNASTFPGPMNINAGTLVVGNPGALGASSATVTVANGTVLDLNGTNMTIANPLTLNGTGISGSGSMVNSSATAGTFAGPVTFGSATIRIGGAGPIALSNSNPITGTDASLTLAGAGGSVGGGLQTGAGGLTVNSTGTWALYGTNTYTGATSIDGGTLQLGDGGATGALTGTSGITNNANLTIDRSNAFTQATDLNNKAITGTGSFTQAGDGTTTLSLANTYTGTTTIDAGTLVINGDQTLATGTVTVNDGGTLGGIGTLGGALVVNDGGTHAPGNSPGLQTINGATTYATGSIFAWDLTANKDTATGGARGTDYDAVNINGGLTVESGAIFQVIQNTGLDFTNSFWLLDRAWSNIFQVTGGITGWAAASPVSVYDTAGDPVNVSTYGSFTIDGTTLSWTAVPEPGTALVGILLGLGCLRRRRRGGKAEKRKS
jgi:fibronectin-binding autotransporter adhesin